MKPLKELFYFENGFYVCTFGRWKGWGMNKGHMSFIYWCKKNFAASDIDHEFIDKVGSNAAMQTEIYRSQVV